MRRRSIAAGAAVAMVGCSQSMRLATPSPRHVSQPVPVNRVNDAAIWVNPLDAAKSRIVITNAERGVEVHDLNGVLLKHLDQNFETDSVAILHDFELKGEKVDLVVATYPDERIAGVRMWYVDAAKAKLKDVAGTFAVPDNTDPLGIAAYRNPMTGQCFVFVTSSHGVIDQLELTSDDTGVVSAKPMRQYKVESKAQGCVVDEFRGFLYVCEEKTGVWRFNTDPKTPTAGNCVIKAGENGLAGDIEGIALYAVDQDTGYLVVVGQGEKDGVSRLNVYDRVNTKFVGGIEPSPRGGNAIEFASGIDVTSAYLPGYPGGLLVVKDRTNLNASEDFKFYAWDDIASPLRLLSSASPRLQEKEQSERAAH